MPWGISNEFFRKMKEKLKILILDREILVRSRLRAIINVNWRNVRFYNDIDHDEDVPDLIILGMISSKARGIRQIKKMAMEFPSSRILIFSELDEWDYAVPFLKAGARGYLPKNSTEETIVIAIDTMLEGKDLFCHDQLKEKLHHDFFLSYLKGNHRKAFIIKERLEGYQSIDRKKLTDAKKNNLINDSTHHQ